MSKEMQINRVLSLREVSGRTEVMTDKAGALWLDDPKEAAYLRSYARGLVVIEFDPTTREISRMWPPDIDPVTDIVELRDGRVQFFLMKSPQIFYLSSRHPRFTELRALLENAARTHRPVAVALAPGASPAEIEDARELPRNSR